MRRIKVPSLEFRGFRGLEVWGLGLGVYRV